MTVGSPIRVNRAVNAASRAVNSRPHACCLGAAARLVLVPNAGQVSRGGASRFPSSRVYALQVLIAAIAHKAPDCPSPQPVVVVDQEGFGRYRANHAAATGERQQVVIVSTGHRVVNVVATRVSRSHRRSGALAHFALGLAGRCGMSSMSPTYQRAKRRRMADLFESGSVALAAFSRRSHRSSSMRIRRNGVPGGVMASPFLLVTPYPLMWVACSYSMPYARLGSNVPQVTRLIPGQEGWPVSDRPETAAPPRTCPDEGTCHHWCQPGRPCFRVLCCGPLSGVYPGDAWPQDVREIALELDDEPHDVTVPEPAPKED